MIDSFRLHIDSEREVSALFTTPVDAMACFVFAHGAGAGMTHPFMEKVAKALFAQRVATLRYQFPYMEARAKRPDPPTIAQAAVRAAVDAARQRCADVPLIAGGKSFGSRMTSQAQAASPLPQVRGLVFFGFPLHPADKPSTERPAHLFDVIIPMLFLQGSKDKLAELSRIAYITQRLSATATLHMVDGADHSFHVPKHSGRTDDDVIAGMVAAFMDWLGELCLS
jgi:uncharacterized protein